MACILLLKIIIIASPLKILIGTVVQGILSDDILACSGYLHKVKKMVRSHRHASKLETFMLGCNEIDGESLPEIIHMLFCLL